MGRGGSDIRGIESDQMSRLGISNSAFPILFCFVLTFSSAFCLAVLFGRFDGLGRALEFALGAVVLVGSGMAAAVILSPRFNTDDDIRVLISIGISVLLVFVSIPALLFLVPKSLPVLVYWMLIPVGAILVSFVVTSLIFRACLMTGLLRPGYASSCCPSCGYDLRGSDSGSCPECGEPQPQHPSTVGDEDDAARF